VECSSLSGSSGFVITQSYPRMWKLIRGRYLPTHKRHQLSGVDKASGTCQSIELTRRLVSSMLTHKDSGCTAWTRNTDHGARMRPKWNRLGVPSIARLSRFDPHAFMAVHGFGWIEGSSDLRG
jgi:hypothetical protein